MSGVASSSVNNLRRPSGGGGGGILALASAAAVSISAGAAFLYRVHDRRALSAEEVSRARAALDRIAPKPKPHHHHHPPIVVAPSVAAVASSSRRDGDGGGGGRSSSPTPPDAPSAANSFDVEAFDASASAKRRRRRRRSSQQQHRDALDKYGVTVVRGAISPRELAVWNARSDDVFAGDTEGEGKGDDRIVWNSGRAHRSVGRGTAIYEEMAGIGGGRGGSREEETEGDDDDIDNDGRSKSPGTGGAPRPWAFWRRGRGGSGIAAAAEPSREEDKTFSKHHGGEDTTPSSSLQEVVKCYFERHGGGIPQRRRRYGPTDIQYLNALPGSTNQMWHRDNARPGLTAIVALRDVRDNGPTELLVGSHREEYSLLPMLADAVMRRRLRIRPAPSSAGEGGGKCDGDSDVDNDEHDSMLACEPLLGCIDAGDAILYDARILHRGRGNNVVVAAIANKELAEGEEDWTRKNDRPVLVVRWDAVGTPPPGAGLITTTANSYRGCLLYAGLFLLRKVHGGGGGPFDKGNG